MRKNTQQLVLFPDACAKKVVVQFDVDGQSSDGGVILLKSIDEGLGLTSELAQHLVDHRDQRKVGHGYDDIFHQRVFGLGLGCEDCNDSERARSGPCLKMACDGRY